MNQVLSYNNYNPIMNPLSNTYSPPVTPTRPCDGPYFTTSGPRSDFAIPYEGQIQYEEALTKWVPDHPSCNSEKKFKTFPPSSDSAATNTTSSRARDESPLVFNESSPVFGDSSKYNRLDGGSDYDESSEVYDEQKYVPTIEARRTTNERNADYEDSSSQVYDDSPRRACAEESSRVYDESSRVYEDTKYSTVRLNHNNNIEYDKSSRLYVDSNERYDLGTGENQDYRYSQTYPYNGSHVPESMVVPPVPVQGLTKIEIYPEKRVYDMDQEFEHFNAKNPVHANAQLYESCVGPDNGDYSTLGVGSANGGVLSEPYVGPLGPDGRPPRRRNTANKKERKRTLTLNKAFSLLRACIPNVPTDTKLSKIKTLKLAKEYIIFLLKTLKSSDPRAWAEGFKADKALYSPRKTQNNNYKATTLKSSNENTDSNALVMARKPKGRTGWPQDVWAFELKPQQFLTAPSVRV